MDWTLKHIITIKQMYMDLHPQLKLQEFIQGLEFKNVREVKTEWWHASNEIQF